MQNICNLIGWKSVQIFYVLMFLITTGKVSMECETQES